MTSQRPCRKLQQELSGGPIALFSELTSSGQPTGWLGASLGYLLVGGTELTVLDWQTFQVTSSVNALVNRSRGPLRE